MKVTGWIGAGTLCVVVALFTVNLVRSGQFNAGGAVFGVVGVVLVVGSIAGIGIARLRTLRGRYPRAFVSNLALYPQLYDQIRELTQALGTDISPLGSRRMVSMVLDDESLRLFAGFPLKEVLAFPSTAITSVDIAKAPQGKWVLSSLEVVFSVRGRRIPLDFCLMNSTFAVPHAVGRAELERRLPVARKALAAS